MIQNQYSIFLIQKTLNQLSKTWYFTKFDIIIVFNQIHICENDEKYTAFQTWWELFEQLIISFDLKNESNIALSGPTRKPDPTRPEPGQDPASGAHGLKSIPDGLIGS